MYHGTNKFLYKTPAINKYDNTGAAEITPGLAAAAAQALVVQGGLDLCP
jgi:hypothetical protein